MIMDLEYLFQRKTLHKYTFKELSETTGISLKKLIDIFNGKIEDKDLDLKTRIALEISLYGEPEYKFIRNDELLIKFNKLSEIDKDLIMEFIDRLQKFY